MNSTQAAGLLAFGCASISCFMVARPRLWRALALCHAALCAEVLLGMRHRLHDSADAALRHSHVYEGRGDWQWMLLAGTIALGLFLISAVIYGHRMRGGATNLTIATLFSLAALMLYAVEIISLHSVDALLYRQLDGLMVIGWLWLVAGGGVAVCALRSRSRASSRGSGLRRKRHH